MRGRGLGWLEPSTGFLVWVRFSIGHCFIADPSGLHTLVCDINREDLREQLAEVEASDLDGVKKEQEEG